MLLSPKAGGVGITLTAANHVIHLSRWWNPAVEDQCTDRALRIGQDKEVHIYYPLAVHPEFEEHSFDINLHRLLTKKRELSRAVLAPVAFTKEDQASLFEGTVQD
jgi:SNF2 family DNA or RNA helicase